MKFRSLLIRSVLWLGVMALAACSPTHPNDPAQANWLTNTEQAMAAARQQGRPLFVAFFGSDWSVASQEAQKEVFDTRAFKDYADANLVLLKIDITRKGLSPELEKTYTELAKGLQVDRLPVFYLADPANGVGPFQRLNAVGNGGPMELLNQITTVLTEYHSQLASQKAQAQAAGAPMGQPSAAPRASGVSGFPSPDQLLKQSQGSPSAPPSPAPAASTDPIQIQLK